MLAGVSLLSVYNSITFQRGMVAVTFIVVLFILLLARNKTPESIRWLQGKGYTERANVEIAKFYGIQEYARREKVVSDAVAVSTKRRTSVALRLFVTITTAFAGTAGFGLMTYVLGPNYFKSLTAAIILVATGTGFISGFLGIWADLISRKTLLLLGYGGTFIMTLIIYLTISVWSKDLTLFWILLVLLNIFVNIAYLTEDTLKSEVWPTSTRGTYTALVRFISIGLYIATIYLSQNYGLHEYMLFNMVIWIIGLAGAVAWYFAGVETGKGATLESASGE
ncbi:hypothetical protein MM817_00543 [Acidibacillus sp. S0AB]|uniref:Major facilitator superfamily (MFS) profile domain-containing protein n=1 Tax=Sulfoacidibacillus ferrooxidans TaxID=2005001 RepID=A0A9X1V775_9BACL|nr:MFS transporter [Sulfoacidibacillus ferrooxidans]MCI0182284.1 hypothetical protein [Sulfoacidibacillus ferrooxidans]